MGDRILGRSRALWLQRRGGRRVGLGRERDVIRDSRRLQDQEVGEDRPGPQVHIRQNFRDKPSLRVHRVLSWGHRNPEGLTLSESLGLLSVEHGPEGGDRLLAIADGANYGWPNVSLGTDYHRYSFGGSESVGRLDGYTTPLFARVPSIAPSELMEVHGFDKRWRGIYSWRRSRRRHYSD